MNGLRWMAGVMTPVLVICFMEIEVAAQEGRGESASIPLPAFQPLRFEEDWSALARAGTGAGADRLKAVSLSADGSSYLSVGGQIRYRMEGVRNFMMVGGESREDAFGLTRVMAHADLHLTSHLRFFVEGRHSVAHGRDLPGGSRPADHDDLDLQNGFVEVSGGVVSSTLAARLGRQELLIGSQRLVSPVDWTNTRRTFDGMHARVRGGPLEVEGFRVRPVVVKNASANRANQDAWFSGVVVNGAVGTALTGSVYLFRLENEQPVSIGGVQGMQDRNTLGARLLAGRPDVLRVELEGGVQRGDLADRDVRAWFVASDVSRSFAALLLQPAITVGFDWASGDQGDPAESGTFQPPFPLGHAYAGYADVLGRQNLVETRGVLVVNPDPRVQVRLAGHLFDRASRADGTYDAGGGLIEAANDRREKRIGAEVDLTSGVRIDRRTRVEVGYGRFTPGEFLTGRPAGARTINWGFASVSYTF